MISETAQEQAALYALGLLDAAEAAAFEREFATDTEMFALVKELQESAAELARAAGNEPPPPGLKVLVMARLADATEPVPGKVIPGPWRSRLPWALAATLLLCCGALEWSRELWRQKYNVLDHTVTEVHATRPGNNLMESASADALRQVAFCPLEPVPQNAPPPPRAAVLWDAVHRQGELRLQQLPPPDATHDYQLWVVETGHRDTISAGVVKTIAGQSVEVSFEPVAAGGSEPVIAFAISLEQAGGSPTNRGPILFMGKL